MYEEEYTEPEFQKRPKKNPFQTPDHYFDSIEDRIMAGIQQEAKKTTTTTKVIQLLKPILGLAACFSIVYLLAYYPIHMQTKSIVKAEATDTTSSSLLDNYAFNISFVDENSLVNAIFNDEKADSTKVNPDELLAYLSSQMTDLDIYSEIQN